MGGYEVLADLMKTLGHPVRLQILQVLRQGEACVCHLETMLGQRQAYISQHLMRLRENGLVVDRREGMNVFYALATDEVARILDAVQQTASVLAEARGEQLVLSAPVAGFVPGCTCPACRPQLADSRARSDRSTMSRVRTSILLRRA
jgi:ArsR family transcriptional regulator